MVTKRLFALGLVCALLVCCAQAANGYTLKLSSSSIRLAPGESRSITWTVEPVNLVSHTVTWSSENSYIASVDQKGRITAHAAGTTYVVAELETGAQRRVLHEALRDMRDYWKGRTIADMASAWQPDGFDELNRLGMDKLKLKEIYQFDYVPEDGDIYPLHEWFNNGRR